MVFHGAREDLVSDEPDRREGDVQSEEMQAGRVPRDPGAATGGPRWFRRRWVLVTASGLVLLVVLAVVGNVVLTRYVKGRVVQALRCVTGDESLRPTVSLGGPPMLVGLASRKVGQVTIRGVSPSVMSPDSASSGLADGDLTITLHGLGLSDPPSVKSAEATVWLPWAGLGETLAADPSSSDLAGATLGAEDGLLAVTLPQEVGGRPLKVLVGLKPDGGSMTVTPQSIVVGGQKIGIGLVSLLAGDLLKDANGGSRLKSRTIDLDLPGRTTVRALEVQSGGLGLKLDVDPALVRPASGAACRA